MPYLRVHACAHVVSQLWRVSKGAGPYLRVLLGVEQGLNDTKVHRLQRRVANLEDVHLVGLLALGRLHEAVLKDERDTIPHVVVATLAGLLGDQARDALCGVFG